MLCCLNRERKALAGGKREQDQADMRGTLLLVQKEVKRQRTGGGEQPCLVQESRIPLANSVSFKERLCWSCCPRFHVYGKCLKSSGDFLISVQQNWVVCTREMSQS